MALSGDTPGAPNMTKVTFRECKLCGFIGKSGHSISLHLRMKHSVSLLEYAEQHEGYVRPRCTVCGGPARYKGDHYTGRHRRKGLLFYATCSDACRSQAIGNKHRGMPHPVAALGLKARWAKTPPARRQEIIQRRIEGLAVAMRKGGSSLEKIIAGELTTMGIAFETQKVVGPYIVDFYLVASDTYVEIDGCYWHGCPICGFDAKPGIQSKAPRQRQRAAYLHYRQLHVCRIAEHDIHDNRDGVREKLQQWAIPREGASGAARRD